MFIDVAARSIKNGSDCRLAATCESSKEHHEVDCSRGSIDALEHLDLRHDAGRRQPER